jgi:D-xylose transport system permease protein
MRQRLIALKQASIDWRLVLMGGVLALIAIIFNVLSGGIFLSPLHRLINTVN